MASGSRKNRQDRGYHSGDYFSQYRDYGVPPRSPAEALEPDYAPEPPQAAGGWHQRPFVKILNNVITVLFVGLIGLALLFVYVRAQFDRPGPLSYSTVVAIPQGDGLRQIASRLEREGIISDQRIFIATVMYFGAQRKLKAGEYAIDKHASMRSVLDTLVEGDAILYDVSIPEGFTSYQVVQRLKSTPHLTGKVDLIPPEGSLMPDTYRFARGTDRNELIARMQTEQKRFMTKIWPTRATGLPIETKDDAIILASIVEKETGQADERPRVASVFINRLRKNMRLQSDPTIIYGLSGGKGTLGRGILKSEIRQMTPYNTYTIKGLPPTPIANPGRAALEAVLRPAKTTDLFFVADGTGGHAFAETYKEHKKNVAEWRIIEKEIRARQAEAERQKQQAEEEATAQLTATTVEPVGSGSKTTIVPGTAVTASSAPPGARIATGTGNGPPVPTRNPKF